MAKSRFPNHNSLVSQDDKPPRYLRPFLLRTRWVAWLLWAINRRRYREVDVGDLRARKRSDTVFIFGSGASLNDIGHEAWDHIGQHDTMGFNWFLYQDFVRADFHLVREVTSAYSTRMIDRILKHYAMVYRLNPHYRDTVLLLQGEWPAIASRRLAGKRFLPKGSPVFYYQTRSRGRQEPPSGSFDEGLVHGPGTLIDSINAAYILGWTHIVLVGIDLYDRRYFWLDHDEADYFAVVRRGSSIDAPHSNVANGMIPYIAEWARHLESNNCKLSVYNSRSLLADFLPVYTPPVGCGATPAGFSQV